MAEVDTDSSADLAVVERLVANHREFLRFLIGRVGSRALAEDILQEAFVKGLAKVGALRDDAVAKAWFYSVLRNTIIDFARRRAAAGRRAEAFARELGAENADPETMEQICQCVMRVAEALKPEYADVVRHVDVEGMSVKDFAEARGISSNNAAARAFRAREALRNRLAQACGTCADHGCLDCSCAPEAVLA